MPPAPFQAGVIPSLPSPTGVPGHEVQLRSSAKSISSTLQIPPVAGIFCSKPLANGSFFLHNQCFVCGKSMEIGDILSHDLFVVGTYYDLATSGWH